MVADLQEVAIRHIKKGDEYVDRYNGRVVWTAEEDCRETETEFTIIVRHADGDTDTRHWTKLSGDMRLPVRRADG